jgi:hypothetical protein
MKTALFTNFSNEPFTGYWNGKPKKFEAGQSLWMPDYLAKHFAKHLTNRELLKLGKERDTSPKPKVAPDGTVFVDNLAFNELFNKAYTPDATEGIGQEQDSIDVQIAVANRNRADAAKLPEGAKGVASSEPQYIQGPADDEDEESSFEGNQPAGAPSNAPTQSGATQ